jgi:chromosome segregation ATPase
LFCISNVGEADAYLAQHPQAVANLLEEKTEWQNTYREVQHEKCQLSATLESSKRELQSACHQQACLQTQVQCAGDQQQATDKEVAQLRHMNSQLQAECSKSQEECKTLQQRVL